MAGFFTNPSDSNYHSGGSIGVIKNGELQTSVNEKLANEIEQLKAQISQMSNRPPVSTTDAIENKSGFGISDTFISTGYTAKVSTTPNASGIDVAYDLTEALGKDTKIFSRVIVEGVKNGLNTIIVDSDKLSSGFFLSPSNFPASLTIDLRKKTSNGDEFLSAKVPLNPYGESLSTALYARKFGGTELNTQTKVNDFLFNRLKELENSFTKEVKVGNETKSIQDAFNKLMSDIDDIKRMDLSNAVVKSGNSERSLSDFLNDISSKVSGSSLQTTASNSNTSSAQSSSSTTSGGSQSNSSSSSTNSSSSSTSSSSSSSTDSNSNGSKDPNSTSSNTPSKNPISIESIISNSGTIR